MTPPRMHRSAITVAVLAFAVLVAGQTPASPTTDNQVGTTSRRQAEAVGEAHRIENHIAQQLATSVTDPTWRTQLRATVGTGGVSLAHWSHIGM